MNEDTRQPLCLIAAARRCTVAAGAVARSDHRRRYPQGHDRSRCSTSAKTAAASAIGARRLYDNAETNHRRYGDPTYFAPSMVELQVIDTRTGATDKVGKGLMNVRQAALTRDGARLAMLTAAETPAGLPITSLWVYDVDAQDARRSAAQRGRRSGRQFRTGVDAGRLEAVRRAARLRPTTPPRRRRSRRWSSGPVVVQSSKPFLDWDAMSRANRRRALARDRSGHRRGDGVRAAPAAITNYQLSRDGSFGDVARGLDREDQLRRDLRHRQRGADA